jgi:hypothetical protein
METEGSNIHVFFEGDVNDLNNMRGLENGDFLTIYSKKNPAKVIWNGIINFIADPTYPSLESYLNHNTYRMQEGIDIKLWNKWFSEGYPASLAKKKL